MTSVAASSSAAAATASSTKSSALSSLTSNVDTFLSILTTEMKNQDPTSSEDNTAQYIAQISQMTMVEAQLETNDKLDTLISNGNSAGNSSAVGYIGKTVTVGGGEGALVNSSCTWNYKLDSTAASNTLTVTDSSGKTVYSTTGDTSSGSHSFTWNGKNLSGVTQSDGQYTLSVASKDANGKTISNSVSYTGKVTAVDTSGSSTALVVGSVDFPLSDVSTVTE